MRISLLVTHHPSGNYTLSETREGATNRKDVHEPTGLFINRDTLDFYRKLAAYISSLSLEGHAVELRDLSN